MSALTVAAISCGREPTAPGGADGVRYSRGIAFVPQFPAGYAQYVAAWQAQQQAHATLGGSSADAAPPGSSDVAGFEQVRIVLNNPDGSIALDTIVPYTPGTGDLTLTLNVPLPASAPASGISLALNLDYETTGGASVFHGGPVTVNAVPASPGAGPPPPSPVTIPVTYTGPGAGAASVAITPKTRTVNTGQGFTFTAQAFDAAGNPVGNTPILFASDNTAIATVSPGGAGTAGSSRGTAHIVAQLLTGQSDAATLTVNAPPASISLVSGSGQSGTVGQNLANPVVVQVNATDGLPAPGVAVTFAAGNGGTVGASTVNTGADGRASTTWKLGLTAGAQSLTASAAGLTGSPVTFAATARSIDPVRVVFVQQPPTTIAAGATFTPAVTVQAVDATGALVTSFTGAITLGLSPGSAAGATLSGVLTQNAIAGVATFADLRIVTPGTYTLAASATSLTGATSNSVGVVAGAANKLSFGAYPSAGATAGVALDPITVQVKDSLGNVVTGFTGSVSLNIASGPAGAAITGTATATAVAGVATFSNLKLNTAGSYTLGATSTGVTSVTGPSFTVAAGPASALFLVSGGGQSATGAAALTNPIVVKAGDAFGNGIAGVTITFTPAAGSGSVNPTSGVSDALGQVQTTWTVGGAAGPQVLNVTAAGLLPNPLVVNATATTTTVAGPATKVFFSQQPANTAAGAPFSPALQVTAKDANGLVATSFSGSVTLSIAANPHFGALHGTVTVAAVAGVATFPGVSIDSVGAGYRIRAGSGALVPDTSLAFNVTGGAIVSTTLNTHLDSLYSFGDFVTKVPTSRDVTTAVIAGTYAWVSRNTAVATVNSAGTITAVANGSTYVVVTETGGTKDSSLVVVQQRIATISITPGAKNIYKTRNFHFTASAVDGRNNPMAAAITWSTQLPGIATVDTAGTVTALSLGATQLRATSGAITGTAAVTVLTPITSIVVGRDSSGTPVSDTTSLTSLGVGRRFVAVAHDTLGAPMTGVTFTWASSNVSVASLDSIFAAAAHSLSIANGNTTIQASADGITGSATLKVSQVLASIDLTPVLDTIGVAGTEQLTARGKDANGRFISGGTFTYASRSTSIATVNASGVVTGIALGTDTLTASSGAITSNNAIAVVSTTVPPIISFGRDTLTVGRGTSTSIPVLLSRVSATPVTVGLAARDTNAYFSAASVVIPAGQTAVNVTLNGRNAGTTLIYATDISAGPVYTPDTAAVTVQANMHFSTGSWSLNAGDQVGAQVILSDPSPAGGTYVTFSYGTAGKAQVSPDPAFIPAGQLSANVIITALGTGNASTTITPVATGVNGSASTMNVSAPILTISAGASARLGAGQFENGWYVYTPQYTSIAVPLTFTSTNPSVATVSPATGSIPAGSYYQYITVSGVAPGTAMIIASAPGWTPDTLVMTITSPRLGTCCGANLVTTSPTQSFTIYAEDSVTTGHYRTSALAITVSSSDTNVIKVIDKTPTIAPGQYYVNGVRYQPGGSGGTAYIKATAGGHASDSILVTVIGPKLEFSWNNNQLGTGQYEPNVYVYTPNNVVNPLTVSITSANNAKMTATPSTVTIPAGSYYAYFTVSGLDTTTSNSFIATAPGYQGDTAYYRVSSPRLGFSGGGTYNNFNPNPQGFAVYVEDSVGNGHYRTSPLTMTFTSRDTNVVKVDSATGTVTPGNYYFNAAHVSIVGLGSTYIVATAPGHRPDSALYTVQVPKLNFSLYSNVIGRRQYYTPTDFYVYTPDNRTSPLAVTFTQKHANVDSLTTTAPTIATGLYYAYFGVSGLALGTDTIIATAPGYVPDTAFITTSTTMFTGGGIPSTANTTNPNYTTTVYATDINGTGHWVMDTVVIHIVSTDTTVIKPTQPYVRILPGQYYVQPSYQYFGPGSAHLTFTDSAGVYAGLTSNTVTVTGPSLVFSNTNAMYGKRQRGGPNDYYVYTQNNVTTNTTVTLVSTDTTVATVPASVVIPAGTNYAYFTITAHDVAGTIQIQATASGFGPPPPITVQVTQPKFVVSTNTTARTTMGAQTITIYATDANGTGHYVTENVPVNVASSSGAVFTVDSSVVTITTGNYYTQAAHWSPVAPGSAQFTATDTRAASYSYNTGAANLSVIFPNLSFSWGTANIGLGQYVDQSHFCCFYVQTQDYLASGATVNLAHAGPATASFPSTTAIGSNSYYSYFTITGTSVGTDTITASLASPFHNPAKAFIAVDSGRVFMNNWPSSLAHTTDSVAVTLYTRDPTGGNNMYVAASTTFTLSPNANVEFHSGGTVITSINVPANAQNSATFYIVGKTTGAGSVTISHGNYHTYSNTVTVP